ncbi:hypothetical protein TYRP_001775 [Tyrophagus putrescentiae]|nr:hypothetical protein TYRP_001697 [Tyrophagus putrescentiae]KAH9400215.1 hypothetical protein TYRP_001775 [Tyrophagus putrescentiae]
MGTAQDKQDRILAQRAAFEDVPSQVKLLKAVYNELYTAGPDPGQWSASLQQLKEKLRAQYGTPFMDPDYVLPRLFFDLEGEPCLHIHLSAISRPKGYPFYKDNADNEMALYSAAIYQKMAAAINQEAAAEKAAKKEQMDKKKKTVDNSHAKKKKKKKM